MSQLIHRVIHSVLRRRGSLPGTASFLCFEANGLGEHFIWTSVLDELAKSVVPCGKLTVLSLDLAPSFLQDTFASSNFALQLLDLHSDPEGWFAASSMPMLTFTSLEEVLLDSFQTESALLIDCLSPIIMRLGFQKVLNLLDCLQKLSNCTAILTTVHTNALREQEMTALRSICTGIIKMVEPKKILLPLSDVTPHGALQSLQTTETGRIESTTEWFKVEATGKVHFFSPPDESQISTMSLVEAKIPQTSVKASDSSGLEESLMKQMEGGMKLTMTQKERDAKDDVLLPYETKTQNETSTLGEIHYERDSEEDFDSDEDPDDDLDI